MGIFTRRDRQRARVTSRHKIRLFTGCLVLLLVGISTAEFTGKYWPKQLPPSRLPVLPAAEIRKGNIVVRIPETRLIGELGCYEDELQAYLMFDYLRTRPS